MNFHSEELMRSDDERHVRYPFFLCFHVLAAVNIIFIWGYMFNTSPHGVGVQILR